LRRKGKGDEGGVDPEPAVVRSAGGSVNAGGAGGSGGGHVNVVPSLSGVGTVAHHNTVAPTSGGYVIGARYPGVDRDPGYCGHLGSIVLVGGCVEGHVDAWLVCRKCQMETMWEVKNNAGQCFMACGHLYMDMIYSYLPSNPEYAKLGNRMFTVTGQEAT
jgi:hypothetical protein